ncbi:MAG: hypothetical protein KAU02_01955 [Tenericutes bacterium]|nr:hypothetical protein [Mycoplasmatota bacterium]
MKKVFVLLIAVFVSIILVGCSNSEFIVDGDFTAYEVTVHSNAPQVTYVTVTIEDGQIVGYNIDVRQGSETEVDSQYTYAWNELTKKELADDYNMKLFGTKYELVEGTWVEQTDEKPDNEWYEQANLVEAYLLENGIDSIEIVDERFSNVAGVTIKDSSYTALAAEALNLAKAGKFQAILCAYGDFYIASMNYDKDGNISNLELDVLQADPDGETFVWNEKTKQELASDYGMEGIGAAYEFVGGEWVASDEKTSLEWYEQANLITDYIEVNGFDEDLQALAGRGGTIDGTTLLDDLAGATVHTQTLYDVITALFEKTN